MKPVLTLVQENLARLEAAKAKIATELSAKELEYKKSIEQFAASYEAVEANIAEYEAMRSRFIAELHKAIRLKLIAIICEKFTPELLAKSDNYKAHLITLPMADGNELVITYYRSGEAFTVSVEGGNYSKDIYTIFTRHKDVDEFEFSLYIRDHLRRLRLVTKDKLPTNHDSLLALCSLLGIEY